MAMRLSRSIVGEAEAEAVRRVIVEDGYLGIGAEVKRFEQELASYLGVDPELVCTANTGTSALTLAVDAVAPGRFGEGPRGSILVPSLTFVASFQACTACGVRPIACEVLPETGTIDLADCEKRLAKDTFAIMPVHYASNPWQLDEVYAFAARHGLRVVEDAAHAFGCRHDGKRIGSFGDVACFSFDGIKNITSGEGGLVVCQDRVTARIAQDARLLSVEGDTRARFAGERTWDPDVVRQGWRFHMSNIMAAVGRVQLSRLEPEFIPARKRLCALYREELKDAAGVAFPRESPRIPVGVHYKPNHLLSYFKSEGEAPFPQTEGLFAELMTLPLHPGLADADVREVCAKIREALA